MFCTDCEDSEGPAAAGLEYGRALPLKALPSPLKLDGKLLALELPSTSLRRPVAEVAIRAVSEGCSSVPGAS